MNPTNPDTDGDGVRDGCEDINQNGYYDYGVETDPLNPDTDCDGLWDGNVNGLASLPTRAQVMTQVTARYNQNSNAAFTSSTWPCYVYATSAATYSFPDGTKGGEDRNNNGMWDRGETSPSYLDSDRDGIPDGLEDHNLDNIVQAGSLNAPTVGPNGPIACTVATQGESDPTRVDTDGDGISDGLENKSFSGVFNPNATGLATETIAWATDTDCDGLGDGVEDKNHNGRLDGGETSPRLPDSDGDGLCDGKEDMNHNGLWDRATSSFAGETNPLLFDTDGDGIGDGVENKDPNNINCGGPQGNYHPYSNPNICWNPNSSAVVGSDPRMADTDGDGISDGVEDKNKDGICQVTLAPDPTNPNNLIPTYVETCAFVNDTDCDGLLEHTEDKNGNGVVDAGETDPRNKDTDHDGLQDGCGTSNPVGCEDKNNNGFLDPGESDPTNPDTDGDLLSDSCEVFYANDPNYKGSAVSGPTKPWSIDTDGDGMADGDEDANHNCQTDPGETDPRVFDAPPIINQDPNYPRFAVCAASSLNNVTFAEDLRSYADVRVAFEEEQAPTSATCPSNQDSECPTGQACVAEQCMQRAPYIIQPFGRDNDGGGFSQSDQNDTLWGWTFQSPQGVVFNANTSSTVNRDIYGFVQLSEDSRQLDDILDAIRTTFGMTYPSVTQTGALPARAAFDSTTNVPVNFAQRTFSVSLGTTNPNSTFTARNNMMVHEFFAGLTPSPAFPVQDPVYGTVTCTSSAQANCFTKFTVHMTAVQRLSQKGPGGLPVVILVVAMTENDSASSPSANRSYMDRVSRLQDLTGGSAVAHFNAGLGKACDPLPQKQAVADVVWVVDDSRSMQQLISRLQQASVAAENILTSNSGIINYRIGMTTTNPSPTGGTQCPAFCDNSCTGNGNTFTVGTGSQTGVNWCYEYCADQALGCIKSCPSSCAENAINPNGYTTCSSCSGSDACGACNPNSTAQCAITGACADPTNPAHLATAISLDGGLFNRSLPGGGGQFYYEDNWFWNCDSYTASFTGKSQYDFISQCYKSPYNTGNFPSFFGGGSTRMQLLGNQGLIGADPNAVLGLVPSCLTTMLDLNATTATANDCSNAATCCGVLTQACDDGATVFSSQMCDLIRSMGGLPDSLSTGSKTNAARRHSAPEEGSLSARRLLQSMIPALPLDYATVTGPFDGHNYNPKTHLRMNCLTGVGGCPATCDPTARTCPSLVPVATVFLSDEEDFYFKDDCQTYMDRTLDPALLSSGGDHIQLPVGCPGNTDPNHLGQCTYAYCSASNFSYGVPTGTNHTQAAWTTDGYYTLEWGAGSAPECSTANLNTSCLLDPCPTFTTQPACQAANPNALCQWTGSLCLSACAVHTVGAGAPGGPSFANNQRHACESDPRCIWDQSQIDPTDYPLASAPFINACRLATPYNDCQACKRFERLTESVTGLTAAGAATGLVGIGQVGPAYAVTRNKGEPAFGTWFGDTILPSQDTCGGGPITWGRGDGQAYRDIATETLGRVQDVCSTDYTDFVQLLVADLAILSKPYPLSGKPIAATIKVGISRTDAVNPNIKDYVPVPRSQTSGFFYDATGNTIGFKSDPVDGQCGNGNCAADGVITAAEIIYAETAPFVPKAGDEIYVSYRLWEPVPCGGPCPPGEICAEVICESGLPPTSCPNPNTTVDPNADAFCAPGYHCLSNTCQQWCTANTLVEACVNAPNCAACQDYNSTTRSCDPLPNTCTCNPNSTQISCNPLAANTCPIGYSCDETCVCTQTAGCPGVTFNGDGTLSCTSGTIAQCGAAGVACCQTFDAQDANAEAVCPRYTTKTPCNADNANNCLWRGPDTGGQCGANVQACCNPGSTPNYFVDPELGTVSIVCTPATCECCCTDPVAFPTLWNKNPQCDPQAPVVQPAPTCSDGAPACACYVNGG